MRILVLNWRDPKNPKSGGAELVTLNHAKAWVRAGNIVTWFSSSFDTAKKTEVIEGIKIIRNGSEYSVHICAFFYYFFSGEKFDIVIDEIHGLPFFTPLYVRKPKIAFIHEVAGEIWDFMYPFPWNLLGKILESTYFHLYKKIPFWTDAFSTIDDLVAKDIPRNNCVAIPCPINNTIGKSIAKETNPTYIFVSRVVKMKGIERVLEAFSVIKLQQKNAKLWIVGEGEQKYIQSLKIRARKISTKDIIFWGRVSESKKLDLMKRAHILLHASVKEGWGLVVLEAASQGTPSVVYNASGLRESVKNGKTGIVIDENSPQELAREALALTQNTTRYATFQKNGTAWVKSITWNDVTRKSMTLLQKIAYNG